MPYTGETLDVSKTLQRLNKAAIDHGFTCTPLVEQTGTIIPVFTRSSEQSNPLRIYISTGMHGDEPAGPLSVLDLLERDRLNRDIDWTLFPMLNPAGLRQNQRENHEGVDLNRDYISPRTKEVKAHIEFIEHASPWDLALILHEDWESEGYYLYDLPTELTNGWARQIIDHVSQVCPIDLSEAIDEMPARDGIISPRFEDIDKNSKLKGQWPEPIYLHMAEKIRGTYTFEAPSSYDLPTRIEAHTTAILAGVDLLKAAKH